MGELNNYIYENKKVLNEYIDEKIPSLKVVPSDSTYLLWIYCGNLDVNMDDFYNLLKNKYGLYVSPGKQFGENGIDFIRINIACPKNVLIEGLNILNKAVNDINDNKILI